MIVGENGVVSVSGKKAGLNSSTACIFQDFISIRRRFGKILRWGIQAEN